VSTQVSEGEVSGHATSVRGFVAALFALIVGSLTAFVYISELKATHRRQYSG